MARVTVEDSLNKVSNRFELVLLASKRARDISMGSEPLIDPENDKPTVVALREIAEDLIDVDYGLKKTTQEQTESLDTQNFDSIGSSPTL